MKGPFYEVAAVTPYTERQVQDKNDGNLLKSRRTAPPISALFLPAQTTDDNVTYHSSGGHISSDGSSSVQTVINARFHGPDSSSTDLSGTQSSSEGICSKCNDTDPLTQSTDDAREIFTETNTDNDVDSESKSSDSTSFDISEVERLRNEALKESLALWQGKIGPAAQEAFGNSAKYTEVLQFAQPAEITSCTSESLGPWIEPSISQRESSISSSWWGGSSVSTGVSLESDMDDCPLLASTMLDLEQKFSSEAEILEAIQKANELAEDESPAPTDLFVTENNSESKQCFTEVSECLELDKSANYNFNDFFTEEEKKTDGNEIKEIESENGNVFTKNSMNFLETKEAEEFPQQVEEKIKFVANQLYVLEKSSPTNFDPPKTKSYRDVLLSAPSTAKTCLNKPKIYLDETELPPLSNINSVTFKESTYPFEKTPAALPEKSNNFLELWMPNIELNTKQSEALIISSVSDKMGENMDSFYSAHSSACQSMSDGSLTSGSESGAELYRTALSRLQDSGDESGTLSDFTKSSSEMTNSEDSDNHSSWKENIASCNVHKAFGKDVKGGNLADVECNCEASVIQRDLVPSDDGSARSRKRQRTVHKQAQNGYSSCSSDTDAPSAKYAAYPEKHVAIGDTVTVAREQVCDSSGFSSSDDCSSARSSISSEGTKEKMSTSRDSSSSSRSSSKSSSSSEPAIVRLNPDCPPFVPRAARLQTLSSTSSSVSGADDKELTQNGLSRQSFGDEQKLGDKKALDTSLMPPPSSTKVLGGGNPQFRRINQLRLSSSFPTDSGIDTTGHYNTSVNMTQGERGQSSAVQVLDDSAFPDVHVADTLEESVFFKSSFMKLFEADKMIQPATETKDLYRRIGTRQHCVEDCIMKDPSISDVFTNQPYDTNVHNDPVREEIGFCYKGSDTYDSLEPSPYRCDLQHNSDFIPIEDLSSDYRLKKGGGGLVPKFNLTPTNVNTIMSLSQRVVRLRVKKPLASYASSNFKFHHHGQEKNEAGPDYDHYGSGFVFNINPLYFEIRTHQAVVGNAEEAARAEVTFDLIIAGSHHMFEVAGSSERRTTARAERTDSETERVNFISNAPHSQVTSFRRSTPARLVPWLHLFSPVPMKIRTSLFEDSCYFSDSSPDCSLVETSGFSGKLQDAQTIKRPGGGLEVCFKNTSKDIQTDNIYQHQNSADEMSASRQPCASTTALHRQLSGNIAFEKNIHKNNISPSSSKVQDFNDLNDSMSDEAFSWDNMVQRTKNMDAGMTHWQGNKGEVSNAVGASSGTSGDTHKASLKSSDTGDKPRLISVIGCNAGFTDTSNCGNNVGLGIVESPHRLQDTPGLVACYTISDNANAIDVTYSHGKQCFNEENSRAVVADNVTGSDRVDECDKLKAENYCSNSGSEHYSFESLCQSQLRQGSDLVERSICPSRDCESCVEYVGEEPPSVFRQTTFSGGPHCIPWSKNVLQESTFQDEEFRSSGEQSWANEQPKHLVVDSFSYRSWADNVEDKFCKSNNCPSMASLLTGSQEVERVMDEAGSSFGQIGSERTVNRRGRSNALATYKYEATSVERQENRKERIPSCPLTPGGPTSRILNRGQRVKSLGDDMRPPSPLVIMERRAATEGQATLSGVGQCPYTGVDIFGQSGLYTPFSSYAGNVLDSIRGDLPSLALPRLSLFPDQQNSSGNSWEYESLLFAQNSHQHTYRRRHRETRPSSIVQSDAEARENGCDEEESGDSVFLPDQPEQSNAAAISKTVLDNCAKASAVRSSSTWGRTSSNQSSRNFRFRSHRRECDGDGVTRVFAPTDPFEDILDEEKYRASWNIDLLNLNPDLTPVQDPGCVESSLAHIFAENEDTKKSCCLPSYVTTTEHRRGDGFDSESNSHTDSCATHFLSDASAIIISHPHGGRKLLSSGFFSRHFHVGGNLYDTPTCMGSCGAPVISLAEDGNELHVTSLVHAGNVTVNGITTGMGVELFPPIKCHN